MTTDIPSRPTHVSPDQFKKIVSIIIAVLTAITGIVAFLQSDAGARDDRANRDSKRYASQALGLKVSGTASTNYDYYTAFQTWTELDLLATSAETNGDEAAAKRYQTLRDRAVNLSPLLKAPYFDPETGTADIARYEADTFLVDVTRLTQQFVAASAVKDAWDTKANTYIVHLTLLAVALFMFGLSITIDRPTTRWIFAGVGAATSTVATIWAVVVFAQPVFDLREAGNAIDAYAQGAGLAYQERWPEAVASFDTAIAAAPDYAEALKERASAQMSLENYQAAASDFERARAAGDAGAITAGDLAWVYYGLGRFDEAVAMNRTALQSRPDELWIQFDLALTYLVSGQVDVAGAEYTNGMESAARLMAEAHAANREPPSVLWDSLDDAAIQLDYLITVLDTGEGVPAKDKIVNPDALRPVAEETISRLKSLSVALEYTGQPPAGTLTATISPFDFGEPIYDDQGEVQDYTLAESFPYGTDSVSVLFDYEGMRDGQEVVFKVYIDDEEDPGWRIVQPWDLGTAGAAEKPLSLAESAVFALEPGEYVVEMYVGSHLAQRGAFEVQAPD